MAAELTDIIADLDQLLEPDRYADYCPNGLQVPGRAEVATVATGVSAHLDLFEQARTAGADLLLVHHGIFWGSGPQALDHQMKARLKALLDADIGLAAYHLPLDAHPQVGNNALLARALGAEPQASFALHRDRPIGVIARFDAGTQPHEGQRDAEAGGALGRAPSANGRESAALDAGELLARVRAATGREPLVFDYGPARIRSVGILTGAGAGYFEEAIAAGVDAFITGEPAERVMAQAREAAVHFLAAGHYATETFGVRALGERLSERFGLTSVFLDAPNPV